MILKIMRYGENNEWWILDNIRRFSYGSSIVSRNEVRKNQPDCIILDYLYSDKNPADKVGIIFGCCRMADGSEYTVEFDTIAYLCNDDGKTFEKLVANYME